MAKGDITIQMLPPSVIALNEELANGLHPVLEAKIATADVSTAADRLAVVAAHCEVILDGYYSGEELAKLCDILLGKLKLLRVRDPSTILTLQ
jgi:hypothetical protein